MSSADELKAMQQPDALLDRDRQVLKLRADYSEHLGLPVRRRMGRGQGAGTNGR
jgi:hypothetical protein